MARAYKLIDPTEFAPDKDYGMLTIVKPDPNSTRHLWCKCKCGKPLHRVNKYDLRNGITVSCGCDRKMKDIPPGTQYERLTVVRQDPENKSNLIVSCSCDGHTYSINRYCLISGHSKSCGCAKKPAITIAPWQIYGRLTVVEKDPSKPYHWLCQCCCDDKFVSVKDHSLRTSHTKSCSCIQKETVSNQIKHGYARSENRPREYEIWTGMIKRCENQNCKAYKNYGGRGITVCNSWRNSFEAFYEDMGPSPSSDYSIERINNNGNYCPENCVWDLDGPQSRNKQNTVRVMYEGKQIALRNLCDDLGLDFTLVYDRLHNGNWELEEALFAPKMKNQFG